MGEQFGAEVTREVLEFSMDRGFVAPEFPVLVEDEPAFVAFYVQLFPFVDIGLVFLRRKIEFTIGIMMVKNNAQIKWHLCIYASYFHAEFVYKLCAYESN